jgi:beta-galactosidase
MVEKYPYLIGDFMWTAFDYLGEAGLGAWSYSPDAKGFNKPYPWLLGGAGVIDILGNPDGEAVMGIKRQLKCIRKGARLNYF